MPSMQEIVKSSELPIKKELATRGIIYFSTIIAGPLGGCYFIGRNFKALGNCKEAKKWYLWGILSTLLLFGLIAILPQTWLKHVPHIIVPAIYAAIIGSYFTKLQGKLVTDKIAEGWKKYAWYKALGLTILCCLVMFLLVGVLILMVPQNVLS